MTKVISALMIVAMVVQVIRPLGLPGLPVAAGAPAEPPAPLPPPPPSRTSTMIDIAQVQGQVHAQSVQKVGDLADKNPNETAAIVRAWLHENAV